MHTAAQGSGLPAPTLPNATPYGVGLHTAAHLAVRIEGTPAMTPGDLLELFWGNRFVAAGLAPPGGGCVDIAVDADLLRNGPNRFHYRLLKPGRQPLSSPMSQVMVKLDCPGDQPGRAESQPNTALPPLETPTITNDSVDLARLNSDLCLRISPYTNMAEGDAITVRWGDLRLDLPPLAASAVGTRLHACVPLELILEAGADPHLELTYCILDRVGNCSGWAPPKQIRVHGG